MYSSPHRSRQPARLPWTHERLVHERALALGHAIDDSTHLTYTSHLQSYLTFCKLHNFAVDPTPDTLSFFTVYMCHHIKPASVDSYLSGICNQLEPFFPHVRTSRKSALVARTLAGCKRMFGSPTQRKNPLSEEHIRRCLEAFPPLSYDNKLFRAILLAGFLGLHRLGELVRPEKGQQWSKTVPRSSAVLHPAQRHFEYVLPTSKTDHTFEGSRILLAEHIPQVASYDIFVDYLNARDVRFPLSPALFVSDNGDLPTRRWFLHKLGSVINDTTIGGHSLRAGGATFFATLGWPDDHIQHLGRWKSSAFNIYIRKNPVVLNALMMGRTLPHPNRS